MQDRSPIKAQLSYGNFKLGVAKIGSHLSVQGEDFHLHLDG
ncbi:hypothetical protein [Moorena producens]